MPPNDPSGNVVSQRELETLHATLNEYLSQSDRDDVEITLYDFRRAHRLSSTQVRQIERDCEAVGSALNRTLRAYLDRVVEVSFVAVDRMTSRQYLRALPEDAALASFGSPGDAAEALVHLDRPLVSSALDMMLGGTGQEANTPRRAMSQVEVQLFRSLVEEIITVMKLTAKCFEAAPVEMKEVYLSPVAVAGDANEEWLVCASYRLRLGSHKGYMTFGLPSSTMHRLLTRGEKQQLTAEEGERAVLTSVAPCLVGVRAVIARSRLSLSQMSRLAVGDVIELHSARSRAKWVEIVIAGEHKFIGVPGIHDGQLAVQITKATPRRELAA